MESERERLDRADRAIESDEPFGEREGVRGGRDATARAPAEGPTADAATGIAGNPDDA